MAFSGYLIKVGSPAVEIPLKYMRAETYSVTRTSVLNGRRSVMLLAFCTGKPRLTCRQR